MTSNDLLDSYWSHYIMLEKEFMATMHYVKLDIENYEVYSDAYAKLLLQIGSEIDVVSKETCKLINPSFNDESMDKYLPILSGDTDFSSTIVKLINYPIRLEPWNDLETQYNQMPGIIWWKAYNKVKHKRMNNVIINGKSKESYKFANLKNTLYSLGGLYHLLLHTYYLLLKNEGKGKESPLPGSRLFKLEGPLWNNVHFPFDIRLYMDDKGTLIMETSTMPY